MSRRRKIRRAQLCPGCHTPRTKGGREYKGNGFTVWVCGWCDRWVGK